jgi:TolB-like protein/Tfp pilus assembly protein PilF
MPDKSLSVAPIATLFVSYARDDRVRAQRLIAVLEKQGYELWWDAKLEGGAAFADSISSALKSADVVLVLWSASSVISDWVRDEATIGRDRKRLVPIGLDASEPPLGFGQYHAIDLTHWRKRSDSAEIRAIVRAIDAIVSGTPSTGSVVDSMTRRSLLVAVGGGAMVVAGGGAILAWQQGWFGPSGGEDHSIAVLPFKNLGGDPAKAYLSEGLTEEIRAALKRIPALRVVAATSSNIAAASGESTVGIARKLGVAFLLEGSVQLAGKTLRIGVDLTDGRTGFSKWSEQVDRPLADIFAVQREIAETVAGAMAARISTATPEVGGTRNVTAYQYYLQGRRTFFAAANPSDDLDALALLDLAIAADPEFAKAHAMRARILTRRGGDSGVPTDARSYKEQGLQAANHAAKLAPGLADAYLALSFARSIRLEFKPAKRAIERAVELAPADADVLRVYSNHMLNLGEIAVARHAATKAAALDPLNDRTYFMLGDIELGALQYRAAMSQFEKAKVLNPESRFISSRLALCLMFTGETEEALKHSEKEPAPFMRHMILAIIRRKLGDQAGSIREFEQLKKSGPLVSYQVAAVLAQWKDIEAAVEALERALEAGDPGITQAKTDPLLIPLHGHPAYDGILRRVGLA